MLVSSILLVVMINEHFTFVPPSNIKKCSQGQIGRAGYNFSIANDADNYCDNCIESFEENVNLRRREKSYRNQTKGWGF